MKRLAQPEEKACRWCGEAFFRRDNEPPSRFVKREHCSRSCQVCTQNSNRVRR